MASLNVDTQAILQAADAFERLYVRAEEALQAARNAVDNIEWAGSAGEQLQQAYSAFWNKYHDNYLQMLRNYQMFLKGTAADGYAQTEQSNVDLTDLVNESIGVYIRPTIGGVSQSTISTVNESLAARLK